MNYITPRELEHLLDHLGWEILDDWGNDGPSLSGTSECGGRRVGSELPIEIRRAAATTWGYVVKTRGFIAGINSVPETEKWANLSVRPLFRATEPAAIPAPKCSLHPPGAIPARRVVARVEIADVHTR